MKQVETFEGDLLGLTEFADRLEQFIQVEHNFVAGGLVLALSSRFGSGKTTFLTMWRDRIEKANESKKVNDRKFVVVPLNAWESDYYGDPLFAIVSSLLDHIPSSKRESILDAAKKVGSFSVAIGNQVVAAATGIDALAAGEYAEKKNAPSDTFTMYEGRKDAMEDLKKAIRDYIKSTKGQVLFLVDELDRCRPDYAISYLETVKHIFDIERAVFILAADRNQLKNSAKSAFGPDLDFEEYYRKFIHREVILPPLTENGYRKIAATYVEHYLTVDGIREGVVDIDQTSFERICDLVAYAKLSPRQIQELFRVLGHFLNGLNTKIRWAYTTGIILMSVLRTGSPEMYRKLGTRTISAEEGKQFLLSFCADGYIDWWFKLILTGLGFSDVEEGQFEKKLEEFEIDTPMDSHQWRQAWLHPHESRFVEIHNRLEQIQSWN